MKVMGKRMMVVPIMELDIAAAVVKVDLSILFVYKADNKKDVNI